MTYLEKVGDVACFITALAAICIIRMKTVRDSEAIVII